MEKTGPGSKRMLRLQRNDGFGPVKKQNRGMDSEVEKFSTKQHTIGGKQGQAGDKQPEKQKKLRLQGQNHGFEFSTVFSTRC